MIKGKIHRLGGEVNASCVTPEGVVYGCLQNRLYRWDALGRRLLNDIPLLGDSSYRCRFVYMTRKGHLLLSHGRHLYLSDDGGSHLHPVHDLEPFGGSVQGFGEDGRGRLYLGTYGNTNANLLQSQDGHSWEVTHTWNARHIHDVKINPFNGWVYVVVGETIAGTPPTSDSHTLHRSTDGGKTFSQILKAEVSKRPLFLSVNFSDDLVILGTDHAGSAEYNFLCGFRDTGADEVYTTESFYTFPKENGVRSPLFIFLERVQDILVAGASSPNASCLLASRNGTDWEVIDKHPRMGFTSASKGQSPYFLVTTVNAEGPEIMNMPGEAVAYTFEEDPDVVD